MVSTFLPRTIRISRKNTSDATTARITPPISDKAANSQDILKGSISKPTPIVLRPNERPESETSSASGVTFASISEPAPECLVPCGICRKSFDAQNPYALFAHLGGHFDRRYSFHPCDECQINFVTDEDLQRHLHSVGQHKSCGFMFQHRQPCTGHHPPRRRELRDDSRFDFCYRLQRWESTQLEAGEATRKAEEVPMDLTPPASSRTFSISSISDMMRFSRHSRLPKPEDVEKALDAKPASSPRDALGTALLRAICTANVDLVASFLDADANVDLVDALGFGVMHYNAQYGSPEIGWLLVNAGADPNGKDRRGRTPLAHAISARNTKLVHYFLTWGAQPEIEELKAVVTSGDVENTEFLLEWWNHNHKPREVLDLLLISAVGKQDRDMVEILLENGARATATNGSGKSALSVAANANDKPMVLLLLENGAEPDGWKEKDEGPLAEVVQYRQFAMTELLCAKVG